MQNQPFLNNNIGNQTFQSNNVPLLSPIISESNAQNQKLLSKRASDTLTTGHKGAPKSSSKLEGKKIQPSSLKYAIISSATNLVDEGGGSTQINVNGPQEYQSDVDTVPKTALLRESSIQTKIEAVPIDIAAVSSSGFGSPEAHFFGAGRKVQENQIDDFVKQMDRVKMKAAVVGADNQKICWDSPTFANTIYTQKKDQSDMQNETLLNFAQTGMTPSIPLNHLVATHSAIGNKVTIDDIVQSSERIDEINMTTLEDQGSQPGPINDKYRGISKLTIKSKKNNGSSTSRVGQQTQWSEQGKTSAFGFTKIKQIKQRNRQKYGLLTQEEIQEIQQQTGIISEEQSYLFNSTMKSQDEHMNIPMDQQNLYPSVKIGAFQYTNSQFYDSPSKMKLNRIQSHQVEEPDESPQQRSMTEQIIQNALQPPRRYLNVNTMQKFKNYKMEYDFIDDKGHQLNNMNDHQLRFGKDRFEELKRAFLSQTVHNPCLFPTVSPVSYKAQSEIQTRATSQLQKEHSSNKMRNQIDHDRRVNNGSVFQRKHQSFSHSPSKFDRTDMYLNQSGSRKHFQFEDFIVGQVGKKPFLLPNLFTSNQKYVADQYQQHESPQNNNSLYSQLPGANPIEFQDVLSSFVYQEMQKQNHMELAQSNSQKQSSVIESNEQSTQNLYMNSFDQTDQGYVHSKLRKLHSKYNSKQDSPSREFPMSNASSGHKPLQNLNPKFNLYGKYGKRGNNTVVASKAQINFKPQTIEEQNDHLGDVSLKESQNQVADSQTHQFRSGMNSNQLSNQSSRRNLQTNTEANLTSKQESHKFGSLNSDIQNAVDALPPSQETHELTKDGPSTVSNPNQTNKDRPTLQVLIQHRKSDQNVNNGSQDMSNNNQSTIDQIEMQPGQNNNNGMNSYSPSIQNLNPIENRFIGVEQLGNNLQKESRQQIFPAPMMPTVLSEIQDEDQFSNTDNQSSQYNRIDRVRAINYSLLTNYGPSNVYDVADQQFMASLMGSESGGFLKTGFQSEFAKHINFSVSQSRLERALQAKRAIMERDIKQLRLYQHYQPEQFLNKENKKAQIIKNDIKQKEIESQLAVECEPVIGKCAIHNQLQSIINCPSQVNTDDVLQILKYQNQDHINSYNKLQYMPAMHKQKQMEANEKARRMHAMGVRQFEQQFQLHQQIHHQKTEFSDTLKQPSIIDPQVGIHAVASQQSLLAASPSNQTYQVVPSSTLNNYKAESPIRMQKFEPTDSIQPAKTVKTHSEIENLNKTETTPGNYKMLNSNSGANLQIPNVQKKLSMTKTENNPDIRIDDQDNQLDNNKESNIKSEANDHTQKIAIKNQQNLNDTLEAKQIENNKIAPENENEKKEIEPSIQILDEKTYHIKTEGKQLLINNSSKKSLNKQRIQRVRPPDQVLIETGKNLNQVTSENNNNKINNEDTNKGDRGNFDRFSVSPDGTVEYKLYYIQELGKFKVPYLNNVVHNHYNHMRPEKTQRLKNIQSILPDEKRAILQQYRDMEQNEKMEVVKFKIADLNQIGQQFDQAFQNQSYHMQTMIEMSKNQTSPQNISANILPSPTGHMIMGNKFETSPSLKTHGSSQKYFKFPLQNSNMTSGDCFNSKTRLVRNDDSKTINDGTYDFQGQKDNQISLQDAAALMLIKGTSNQQSQNLVNTSQNKGMIKQNKIDTHHSPSVGSESKTYTYINDKTKTENFNSRPLLDSSRLTLQYKQSHGSFINYDKT